MRFIFLLLMIFSTNIYAYNSNMEIEAKYSAINIYPISYYSIMKVEGIGPRKYNDLGYQLVLTRPYKISNSNYGIKKLELYTTRSDKSSYRDSTDYGLIDRSAKTSFSKLSYCEYYIIFSSINSCLGWGLSNYNIMLNNKRILRDEEIITLKKEKLNYFNILLTASFDYDFMIKFLPIKSSFFVDYSSNPFAKASSTFGYGLSFGFSI